MNLHVRGVDPDAWRELRAFAVRLGLPVGVVLTRAIRHYLIAYGAVRDAYEMVQRSAK